VEVSYGDKKLEKSCTNDRQMGKEYTQAVAKALKLRIKSLEAAENMLELLDDLGKWHPLEGDLKGCWGASLTGNWRIRVRGVDAEELAYQWEKVEVVTVEKVYDYHEKKVMR